MKATLTYSDGTVQEHDTIQEALRAALAQYPDGYAVDAGGWGVDVGTADANYDVRDGRAAMVWASEAESINDPGANAVAEITVADGE